MSLMSVFRNDRECLSMEIILFVLFNILLDDPLFLAARRPYEWNALVFFKVQVRVFASHLHHQAHLNLIRWVGCISTYSRRLYLIRRDLPVSLPWWYLGSSKILSYDNESSGSSESKACVSLSNFLQFPTPHLHPDDLIFNGAMTFSIWNRCPLIIVMPVFQL